jgi:hypothetical protein
VNEAARRRELDPLEKSARRKRKLEERRLGERSQAFIAWQPMRSATTRLRKESGRATSQQVGDEGGLSEPVFLRPREPRSFDASAEEERGAHDPRWRAASALEEGRGFRSTTKSKDRAEERRRKANSHRKVAQDPGAKSKRTRSQKLARFERPGPDKSEKRDRLPRFRWSRPIRRLKPTERGADRRS